MASHTSFASDEAEKPASASTRVAESMAESFKLAVASISLVGVGCASGYYLTPAGFLAHNFKDRSFFLWMLMAIFLPVPMILILQEKFDQHFDERYGPRQTYFFRIIAVQMILAAVFACYALSCKSAAGVLLCGVLIGCFSGATLSSTLQLMSAWDPHLVAWATLGRDVAGALPVVTYLGRSFSASAATTWEFQSMQAFPILIVCLCAVCLTCLHFAGAWDKAYSRLGYDLWDHEANYERIISDADPLVPPGGVDSTGAPLWAPKWQFANGFGTFLSFMPLPLVTSMRNPDITQRLILGKLAMDCLGRCIAAVAARTEWFGISKPRHNLLVGLMTLRMILFSVVLVHLHLAVLPLNTFAFVWLLHYLSGTIAASQIDVTIVRFAPVALRKGISRRNIFANFTGLALGLTVDVFLILVV